MALAAGTGTTLYALSQAPSCSGLELSTSTDGGGNWTPNSCVQDAQAGGPVGLAVLFGYATVVDGTGAAYVSSNGGQSFTKGG